MPVSLCFFSFRFRFFSGICLLIEEYIGFTAVFFSICTLFRFSFVLVFLRSLPFVFHLNLFSSYILALSSSFLPLPSPNPIIALLPPLLTLFFHMLSFLSRFVPFPSIPASSSVSHPLSHPILSTFRRPRFLSLPPSFLS